MTSISWINSSGGTWSTGPNWSTGTVPGPSDSATISVAPAPGLSGYTITIDEDASPGAVTLDQTAATLDVGVYWSLSLGYDATGSCLNATVTSGTVSAGTINWLLVLDCLDIGSTAA